MKEIMNYEEKAKAYDDALERAIIWQDHLYDTNDRDYADELNYIFPELQERKNEKINKNLITFFKDNYGTNSNAIFAGIKVKDIVAWLEKQGEKKSSDEVLKIRQ